MNEFTTPYDDYKEVEVLLYSPDKFLCVVETLSRIGISGSQEKTLFQSCHILHKKDYTQINPETGELGVQKYYIKHFKEMFKMDGKHDTIEKSDIERRNRIAMLLDEWNLIKVVDKTIADQMCPMSYIRVVGFKDKANWNLIPKYKIGRRI